MIMRRLLLSLGVVLLAACSEKQAVGGDIELIAHAGGAIEGHTMTNSLEAFEMAVARGYRYVELDLQMTSDSVMVAAHSWRDFNESSGYAHWGDSVPSLSEFKSRIIKGRFTPLTATDIMGLLEKHGHVFLVTDKISDASLLERFFPGMKHRMVVEAFSYKDFEELRRRGFHRVLYSCMADDVEDAVVKHLLLHGLYSGDKIDRIALHTSAFGMDFFKFIDTFCDYDIALFTVNDISDVPPQYMERVKMVYTDSITPPAP